MVMQLWLLRPVAANGWEPWYDKAFGFVIRAESADAARGFAEERSGDESRNGVKAWLDPKLTTCVPLNDAGQPGVIIRDFAAAWLDDTGACPVS